MKRFGIFIAVCLFFAVLVFLLLLLSKPDPESLRFIAGRPSTIGAYKGISYDWSSPNACKLNRLGREDFLLGGSILIAGSR